MCVSMPSWANAIKVSSRKGRKMVEIVKILNGEPVMLIDKKELQVPSFVNDPNGKSAASAKLQGRAGKG